jgi:hypothetical protein
MGSKIDNKVNKKNGDIWALMNNINLLHKKKLVAPANKNWSLSVSVRFFYKKGIGVPGENWSQKWARQ